MKLFRKIKKNIRRSQKALSIYMALLSISMNLVTPYLLSYSYVAHAEDITPETINTTEETKTEEVKTEEVPTEEEPSSESPSSTENSSQSTDEETQAPAEETQAPTEESSQPEPAPVQESPTPEDTIIETPAEAPLTVTETPVVPAVEGTTTPVVEEPQGEILDTGASDYRPEPTAEVIPTTTTDAVDGADPVVQSIEELSPVNADPIVAKECLSEDRDITNTDSSDWVIDSDKTAAETKEKVKLGIKYIFPEEEKVTVTFSCLPKNEADRATLKIQKIKISDLKLPEGVTGSGEYAYDITTDMKNGNFEFEVTLPKDEGSEAKVSYIEKTIEEATNTKLNSDEVKEVDNDKLEQKDSEVKVTGLDHFTIYFVQGDLSTVIVAPNIYTKGDTVNVKADSLGSSYYYKLFLDPPSAGEFSIGNCTSGSAGSMTASYANMQTVGEWEARLYRYSNNTCSSGKHSTQTWPKFTVTDLACNASMTYSDKTNDFDSAEISIDFKSSDTKIDISAKSGYELVNVWLGIDGGAYISVGSGPFNNYDPSGNKINKAKVEVKRVCAPVCGDSVKNGSEQCDGSDLGGLSTAEFTCKANCTLDLVEPKVTICHATSSNTNPYNQESPNKTADLGAHNSHNGPLWYLGISSEWGDIIPPFNYIGGSYVGKNWTTEGQAIYNNRCEIPQKGLITITKDAQPDSPQPFSFIDSSSTPVIPGPFVDDGNADGSETGTYTNLPAGTYTFTENAVTNWVLTNIVCTEDGAQNTTKNLPAGSVTIQLEPGEHVSCTFTNAKQTGPVYAHKFEDKNGNGIQDLNEPMLGGWSMELYDGNNCTGPVLDTQVTDASTGIATFANRYLDQTYSVKEIIPNGEWLSVTGECNSVSLISTNGAHLGFGNYKYASISGQKYNDLNGNGAKDAGESGLANWTIQLYNGPTGGPVASTTTDSEGNYSFSSLLAGTYSVREVNQEGWAQTSSNPSDQQILSGDTITGLDFGNKLNEFCGDGKKTGEEQCDGTDGVTSGENFCSRSCKLIPIYNGGNSCPAGTTEKFISTTYIDSTDTDGETLSLLNGHIYLFKVSDTFVPTCYGQGCNQGWFSDAGYTTGNNWSSTLSDYGINGSGNNYAAHALLGDLGNGVGVVNWGSFTNSHNYAFYTKIGTDSPRFLIGDRYLDWFDTPWQNQGGMGDNHGSLKLDVYECDETPVSIKAQKVVCDSETYLPNWGTQGSTINENTAANYVATVNAAAQKEVCRVEDQWTFQWGPAGAGTFGSFQTDTSVLSGPWNTFTANETVNITDLNSLGGRIEVREIVPDNSGNFIGFSNSSSNVSAEFYCTGDAAGYDNWEWINNPQRGQTYYCVAFNSREIGRVVGSKYNDLNGSGVRDNIGDTQNTEPGLSGWTIQLKNVQGEIISSTVTDEKGDYWFDYLAAGNYTVCEVPQAGWTNSDPTDGSYCKAVTVSGAQETVANFGNRQLVKISASKVICTDEKDLPNWGTGYNDVTSTTAADWVNSHESCKLVPDWKFQWSYDGVGNPGDNTGEATSGWNTFGPTDSSGNTSVAISDLGTSPTHKLWFREVMQEGFIPFTYGTSPDNSNNVSAEFYCNSDVLNYDNWEWIDNPQYGQTYYCVAFNSPGYQNLTVTKSTNPAEDRTEFNISLSGGTVNGTREGVVSNNRDQVYKVLPGTYSVSEVTPAGWTLTDNGCENVKVVLGQDATCNLENSRLGSLNIVKDAVPNSPQDFRFTISGSISTQSFSLDDDSNPTLKNNKTFSGLSAGTYNLSEAFISDWGLSQITCTGVEGFTPNYEEGKVKVTLAWGQDGTCTFTNTKLGSVSGFKYNDRDGDNTWDTLLGGEGKLNGWRIFVDENNNQKYDLGEKSDITSGWLFIPLGMYTIDELLPGTHKICEEMKPGWTSSLPGNAVCKTVEIGIGENKQWVNFGNHQEVRVLASKVVCDKESDLPNWGADTRTYREIDANTAQNWVDDHEGCKIVDDWEFEWAQKGTGNPGDALIGYGGKGWTAFGPTVDGIAEAYIPYVEGDRLEFREVLQTGYVPFSFGENNNNRNDVSAEFYCSDDVANYDNWDFVNDPKYGYTYYCVGFNAKNYGTITVDKVTKPSRNETKFDFHLDGVGENKTSIDFSLSDSDEPYVNSQLEAGTYSLTEEERDGWSLESIDCTNNGEEIKDNTEIVINPGDEVSCTFTNEIKPARLHVSKWNDTEGNLRHVGNLIKYWIKVWTDEDGSILNDVKVVDLLPKGFKYISGSWRAYDYNDDPMDINEPHYASPGTWEIGALEPGQSVTLEYTAEIQDEVDSGLYKDLAWSKGTDPLAENVLGLADEVGYVNDNFVGTQVEVGVDNEPEEAKVDTKTKEEKEEVLGAATSILPATGISPVVIYVIATMVVLGGVLMLLGAKPLFTKRKKTLLPLIMVMFSALMAVGGVHAQSSDNLIVRIEDPKSPAIGAFNLTFVVMDLVGSREITADCYKKGPLDADFVKFETATVIPGGDTKNCTVSEAILNEGGEYNFRVEASADSDSTVSDEVSVDFDATGPGKPKWIEKRKMTECKNEITFKTANDGQTSYVEVYRSSEKEFTVGDSNRIEKITVGPNEEYAFTDEFYGSDCGKKYYYGVRAFDDSDNASSVRSEEITKTTKVEIVNDTEQDTEALLALGGNVGSLEQGIEGAKVVLGDEASVLGEETSEATTHEGSGTLDGASNKMVLWVGFALVALAIVNVVRKKLSGK